MFKFLRERREAAERAEAQRQAETILGECAAVLRGVTSSFWYMYSEADFAPWKQLVETAHSAGLGERDEIRRVEFMLRLLSALKTGCDTATKERLVEEASALNCVGFPPVTRMVELLGIDQLAADGPQVLSRDASGRGVYFDLPVEYKNRPGILEIREDGLTFTGEVLVEIAWGDVAHVANTTHESGRGDDRVEYAAVAVQEGKRRTPTKFALPNGADFAQALIAAAWQRNRHLGNER